MFAVMTGGANVIVETAGVMVSVVLVGGADVDMVSILV